MAITLAPPTPRAAALPSGRGLCGVAQELQEVLERAQGAALWSLSDAEIARTVRLLDDASTRLQSLLLRTVGEADRRGVATSGQAPTPFVSTAAWLGSIGPARTRRDARQMVALAAQLDSHPALAAGLADGSLRADQARVVADAVDALPAHIGPAERRRAEDHLIGEAAVHDADALKALGTYLWEVIDPGGADEALSRRLEAEERRAEQRTTLSMSDTGRGTTQGRFVLPTLQARMLTTALQAIANPALPGPVPRTDSDGRALAGAEVMGQALARLVERIPPEALPSTGGLNAYVVVTIPLQVLEGRLGTAELLGSRHRLSGPAARRLACQAGVIPAVLGGDSAVLDLGHRTRLHTRPQRIAMTVEQGGTCGIHDCDTPAAWADAHHVTGWASGGPTTVENGVLLCPRHHTLTHQREHTHHLSRTPAGWTLQRRQ
jgi:hypothetical protein